MKYPQEITATVDLPEKGEMAYIQTNSRLDKLSDDMNKEHESIRNELSYRDKSLENEIKEETEFINKRIDNIISNNAETVENGELIDIRCGADGNIYDTAGTAIRSQIKSVSDHINDFKTDFAELSGRIYYNDFVLGTINSLNNINIDGVQNRLRTDTPIKYISDMYIYFKNICYPIIILWLDADKNLIHSDGYIVARKIVLNNYAPENAEYFKITVKYDDAGEHNFSEQEIQQIHNEIIFYQKGISDEITFIKNNLIKKADKDSFSINIKGENTFYDKNVQFSDFTSSIQDSSRYVSDCIVEKEGYLKSVSVPPNLATACNIICGSFENNIFTLHHEYGSFEITNGSAQINDIKYRISPGERIFIKFTGGFYYMPKNNPCIFLNADRKMLSQEHYSIAYNLEFNDVNQDMSWISENKELFESFAKKTYVAYGDSITSGYLLDGYEENLQFKNNSVNVYSKYVAESLKMNYYNFGYSAHGFSVPQNYTLAALIEKHHTNADVVTVAMGTNDYGLYNLYNVPFGDISDNTETSFCGSVRSAFNKLMQYYPKAEIIILLPLPRTNMGKNGAGKTLYDYADAIKRIAEEYNFPVVDPLREGGIHHKSSDFMSAYSIDGLHWNSIFHQKYLFPKVKNAVIKNAIIN